MMRTVMAYATKWKFWVVQPQALVTIRLRQRMMEAARWVVASFHRPFLPAITIQMQIS